MTVTDGNIMISFVFKRQTKSLWEREEKKKENAAFVWFNFFRSWIPTALMMPFSSSKATWGNEKNSAEYQMNTSYYEWTDRGASFKKKKKKKTANKNLKGFLLNQKYANILWRATPNETTRKGQKWCWRPLMGDMQSGKISQWNMDARRQGSLTEGWVLKRDS